MADDIEDVSFLPGDNLNRKSVYEPSAKQRCKQLVCSQGRATAIVVTCGLFILIVTLIAAFARPGSGSCEKIEAEKSTPAPNNTDNDRYATNGEIFPWQSMRLPKTVEPISYEIFLHPNISLRTFSGTVRIKARIKETTSMIVLHTKNLTINSVKVNPTFLHQRGKKGKIKAIIVKEHLEFLKNEQLAILTDRDMYKSTGIIIHIDFQSQLYNKLSGFYLSSYKTKSGETRHIGTTQFESTGARQAFPCFDEPALKATFKLSVVREKQHKALFNMPLQTTEDYKDGLVLDKFQESVKMSTYLVAFVVCDFESKKKKTKSGIEVNVYAAPDKIDQVDFALHVAVTVLESYNKLYNITYPLPKLDLIAIPDFSAGAMENWGLVTYRESALLYHPGESSDSDRQWVAIVIAHELAHQWFGNLVTLKWWDDLWLNEGFASFVEFIGTNAVDPTLNMDEQFIIKVLQRGMQLDSKKSSHPVHVPVLDPHEIDEIFDDISYDKGASIIRMLQDVLGQDNFQMGITNYLNKYKYGNAVTADLWKALSEKSENKINVADVMDTWTLQMGYPVVTVSRHDNKFILTQKRFLIDESSTTETEKSLYGYKWEIPFRYSIQYTDGTNTNDSVWLHKGSADIDILSTKEVKFIQGNHGMFGFYRVNYEASMWKSIINQLQSDHTVFSSGDRAGMIGDAFYLARAGLLPQTTALDLTMYLEKEKDYSPWYTALDGLDFIKERLKRSPAYEDFRAYTLKLLQPVLNKLTWNEGSKDTPLQKFLRSNVLSEAVDLGDRDASTKGRQQYDDWMNKNTSISPNLKDTVFSAGIKYGQIEEWEYMLQRYNVTQTPSNKDRYLRTLGETKDGLLIDRMLYMALKGDLIKHQDLYTVIKVLSANPSGHLSAWRFVRQNWDKIAEWFQDESFLFPVLVKSTTGTFSTEFDYTEVKEFFQSVKNNPAKRAVTTALEDIRANINWSKSYEEEVKKWLHDHV